MTEKTQIRQIRRRNSLTLIGLCSIFILPLLFAYYLSKNPDSPWIQHAYRGTLITPAIDISPWQDTANKPREPWTLLWLTPNACDDQCQGMMNALARVIRSLGGDQSRVARAILSREPAPSVIDKGIAYWQSDNEALTHLYQVLSDAGAMDASPLHLDEPYILIIDPNQHAMMRFSADADLKHIRHDLRHLLKVNAV